MDVLARASSYLPSFMVCTNQTDDAPVCCAAEEDDSLEGLAGRKASLSAAQTDRVRGLMVERRASEAEAAPPPAESPPAESPPAKRADARPSWLAEVTGPSLWNLFASADDEPDEPAVVVAPADPPAAATPAPAAGQSLRNLFASPGDDAAPAPAPEPAPERTPAQPEEPAEPAFRVLHDLFGGPKDAPPPEATPDADAEPAGSKVWV